MTIDEAEADRIAADAALRYKQSDQIPPADELYAVRQRLRELSDREKILRALVLVDPAARVGNAYLVEVKDVQTSRVDLKELRAAAPELVAEHTYKLTEQRVEIRAIDEETGEITRIKRGGK